MKTVRALCSRVILTALLVVPSTAYADAPVSDSGVRMGGPPPVSAPVPGHPVRFYSVANGEVYALMKDHTVRVVSSNKVLLELSEDQGWKIDTTFCSAVAGEKVVCLYRASKSESSGNQSQVHKRLVLMSEAGRKEVGHGSGERYDIGGLGIHLTSSGRLSYVYSETEPQGQSVTTNTYFVTEEDKVPVQIGSASLLATLANLGGGDRVDPPVQFVEFKDKTWLLYRDGESIAIRALDGKPQEIAKRSLHDIRAVTTSDGWLYVFYHDAGTGTANVAKSRDGATWSTLQLDEKESGWQLEAVASGETAVCVYYYMRNTFNKGLRAAFLKAGAVEEPPFTIVREEKFNTGWHPSMGLASDGTLWLTWLQNVEQNERAWSKLASVHDLKKHEIKGGTGWEESYKDYYLQTGVGVWYTWWMLADAVPSSDMNNAQIGKTSYNVGAALLTSANLEARYGSFNLGASYAQSVIDDASKAVGGNSGVLNGQIKIDDLLLGHDLKLAFLWGRYRGKATPSGADYANYDASFGAGGADPALEIKTNYLNAQILLLNKWRVKYGLDYSTFAVPVSLHAWHAKENSTSYEYAGSFFRDVTYRNFNLIVGYSKLDYAAKYENHYNSVFLDGAFSFGLSLLKFSPVPIYDRPLNQANPVQIDTADSATTFNLRLIGQLGWLYFHRWKATHGLGIYLRPAYTADWGYLGVAGKPEDRKSEDAKSADTRVNAGLSSLRHGPWLDIGVVW